MKITDEMLEAATDAYWNIEDVHMDRQAVFAALKAVAPLIIEECAKSCEHEILVIGARPFSSIHSALTCAAESIRALKEG